MNLHITKYGNRNWAVWIGGELLAVTVYKKGARAIVTLLEGISAGTTGDHSAGNRSAGSCSDEHQKRGENDTRPLLIQGVA